jgi:hypothetical protein
MKGCPLGCPKMDVKITFLFIKTYGSGENNLIRIVTSKVQNLDLENNK